MSFTSFSCVTDPKEAYGTELNGSSKSKHPFATFDFTGRQAGKQSFTVKYDVSYRFVWFLRNIFAEHIVLNLQLFLLVYTGITPLVSGFLVATNISAVSLLTIHRQMIYFFSLAVLKIVFCLW